MNASIYSAWSLDYPAIDYLIQNSQAVKKECGPKKGYGEKRCEIQGGGQEMAVMVGYRLMVKILITTIQVNFGATWSWHKIHLNCHY